MKTAGASLQSTEPPAKRGLWKTYRWTLTFLKPYRLQLALLILCGFIVSFAELAVPKVLQYFIDKVLPAKDLALYQWLLAGLSGLIGVMLILQMAQNLLQRIVSEQAAKDMQLSIIRHLRKLGYAYYEQHPVGETLSLFNTEVTAVQRLFNHYFPRMLRDVFFLAISLGLLLSIHAGLSLLIFPGVLSYYLVGPYIARKAAVYDQESVQVRAETDKKSYDSIVSVTELRTSPEARKWDFDRFMEMQEKANGKQFQQNIYAYMRGGFRNLSVHIGLILVFAIGISLVRSQSVTVGEFVAFSLYYTAVAYQMTQVVTNVTEQRMLMNQAERIYAFIRQRPIIQEAESPVDPVQIRGAISFEHVSFGYKPNRPVIDDFHLQIAPGERIALVGTSGNGKSTIVKLLGRFYDPTAGTILLDGVSIRTMSLGRLRDAVGFVFQETYLFGSSIKDNIRFGRPEATDEEIVQAATAAYAHEFIAELPKGYDTLVGERGVQLSGGQKQRIAIARMLVKDPKIIILDEATSALDNISEGEVLAALQRLMAGRTTIAIAHRLSTVRDYDRIVLLEGGTIQEIGDYETLMKNKGPFYRLAAGKDEG